jgi:hypothetical protein
MSEEGKVLDMVRAILLGSTELQMRGLAEANKISRLLGSAGLPLPGSPLYGMPAAGIPASPLVSPAGTKRERSEMERFAFEATRLSLEHYNELLKLSTKHFDRVAADLSGGVGGSAVAQVNIPTTYEGPRAASADVEVENPLPQKADVTFSRVSFRTKHKTFEGKVEARRKDAGKRRADDLTLDAYKSGTFKLQITPDIPFPRGEVSFGSARVFVGDRCAGALELDVAHPASPPRGPRAKRRRAATPKKARAKAKKRARKK